MTDTNAPQLGNDIIDVRDLISEFEPTNTTRLEKLR